jgi:hypothetical protein
MNVKLIDVAWVASEGTEGASTASRFDRRSVAFPAVAQDLWSAPGVPPGAAHKIDRFSALALLVLARLRAHLPDGQAPERVGVFVGNVCAGWGYGEPQLANLVDRGPDHVHAFQATAWFPAAAQGEATIFHGWKGVAKTFSGSRCAFAEALTSGCLHLHKGEIDFAFAGVADSYRSDFLTWGADTRNQVAHCAEGALFALLAREEVNCGRPILANLKSSDDDPASVLLLEGGRLNATNWIAPLAASLTRLLREQRPSFLGLPLSARTHIELSSSEKHPEQ